MLQDDFVMLAAAMMVSGAIGLSFASTHMYMGYHICIHDHAVYASARADYDRGPTTICGHRSSNSFAGTHLEL